MANLITCPWCKFQNSYNKFNTHLLEEHFLPYQVAVEISALEEEDPDSRCYKCGSPKTPLTFIFPNQYYIHCWDCTSNREKKMMVNSVLEEIKEYYNKVLSDRYLQLFLIDPIYFESTLPHTYDMFKMILGKKELPSRNSVWFVDWLPGFPKIISRENLGGIVIKDLGELYNITLEKEFIKVNSYMINSPQVVKYDQLHHGRYNILNPGGIRSSKRLRIPKTDTCYKFYNNPGSDNWKSILKIVDKDGNEINPSQISPLDFLTLKLALLRNKPIMRIVFQIISTILDQGVGVFCDKVFLRNTIKIDPENRQRVFNLSWTAGKDIDENKDQINISIL